MLRKRKGRAAIIMVMVLPMIAFGLDDTQFPDSGATPCDGPFRPVCPIDALYSFSLSQLASLKWGLAILFIILNYLFLKWAFQDLFFIRLLLWMMAVSFVLAVFFLVGGKVIGMPEPGYNIACEILGFMQSPVPALVLFVIGRLRSRI